VKNLGKVGRRIGLKGKETEVLRPRVGNREKGLDGMKRKKRGRGRGRGRGMGNVWRQRERERERVGGT
jgi:hypothetical protein